MFPVIETTSRVICFLRPTYPLAQTTAALDSTKFSAINRDLPADVETGWYLPTGATSVAVAVVPQTDTQTLAAIRQEACDYGDLLVDLLNPAWYFKWASVAANANGENAADKQRYRYTRLRIISPCACIQAAASAGWSVERMRGLLATYKSIMPLEQPLLREFFRDHSTSQWATAFGANDKARAVFSGNSDSRVNDPAAANSDAQAPVAWTGGTKTVAVNIDRDSDPQDFNT